MPTLARLSLAMCKHAQVTSGSQPWSFSHYLQPGVSAWLPPNGHLGTSQRFLFPSILFVLFLILVSYLTT